MKPPFEAGANALSQAWPGGAGLISTNPARCRDCYRWVRACPQR